jgi:hypothetical protein
MIPLKKSRDTIFLCTFENKDILAIHKTPWEIGTGGS